MKKACCVLVMICLIVSVFSGCSVKPLDYVNRAVDYFRSNDINITPANVIDKAEYSWPQAYGEVLGVYLSRYGKFSETKGKSSEEISRAGVFFAGLLDWDSDGTPEFYIACSGGDSKSTHAQSFEVYSFKNGKAVPVLAEKPGENPEAGGSCAVSLLNSEGGYIIGVSHSFNGAKKNDRSFYTYDGEKVNCEKLYFGAVKESAALEDEEDTTAPNEETTTAASEAETAQSDETTQNGSADETGEDESAGVAQTTAPEVFKGSYSYFAIDGAECSRSEFNEKLTGYEEMNGVEIDCSAGADISTLSAFFSGTAPQYTDPYSGVIYATAAKG